MSFRFFLIPTFLLVGIATVAIGAPVAETIESIKAIEIPQMGSGNLTLNRRFINGLPGIPECTDPYFSNLISSSCLTSRTIQAICAGPDPWNTETFDTACPDNTSCMVFRTDDLDIPTSSDFSLCVKDENVVKFNREHGNGVICRSLAINLNSEQGTVSISVYDSNQNPLLVNNIEVHTKNQDRSMSDTSFYSIIINRVRRRRMRVCLRILYKVAVFALFTALEGTYSSKG
ncbi:hypothetical protein Glove_232g183 [Diversispora epigaea]|uniref:Uncharacterized protein n=1 Tax=Diversispora epigaea TaxID=1348612 RepID=A0A397IJ42_9GLOM|nr:hypothetical protein Glove_232g183 [Diversispora epigaea]